MKNHRTRDANENKITGLGMPTKTKSQDKGCPRKQNTGEQDSLNLGLKYTTGDNGKGSFTVSVLRKYRYCKKQYFVKI